MIRLYQHAFCPLSRYARLLLSEYACDVTLIAQKPWETNEAFLAINPAGTLPVLVETNRFAVIGFGPLGDYLHQTQDERLNAPDLLPSRPDERAEVLRLVDWFCGKFYAEVTVLMTEEKIYKRQRAGQGVSEGIEMVAIHAARRNIRNHLPYCEHLLKDRPWFGGEHLSLADFSAAAQFLGLDYFSDVPWEIAPRTREWFAKMKSRPAFRSLLAENLPGIAPAPHFLNPDF